MKFPPKMDYSNIFMHFLYFLINLCNFFRYYFIFPCSLSPENDILHHNKEEGNMKKLFLKPIQKQFQIILCCLIAIGLFLSTLCYRVIDNLMTENAAAYSYNTAHKFYSEVEFLFNRIDAIFNSLLFDENIEQFLHHPFSAKTPAYLSSLQTQFSSFSLMNQDLAEIALVSPEMSWSTYFDASALRRFSDQLNGVYGTSCFGLHSSSLFTSRANRKPLLVFGHNVYGMHDTSLYGDYLGSIILSVDLSRSSITIPADSRSSTCFFLVDRQGSIFPFNCLADQCSDVLSQMECLSPETLSCQTQDYLIYTQYMDKAGIFLVSAMNRHELNRDIMKAAAILIGITALSLIFVLLLMYLILSGIVRPLRLLFSYINEVKSAPLSWDHEALRLTGCAELVSISASFNDMLDKQRNLNQQLQDATVKLYETKLGLKQAELDYLRSQINPHFLYNTLETIQALAVEQQAPEIADAAAALGKLLRHSIKGSPTVPFSQELELTHAYLTIQKLRFPNRLNVLESVRENTLSIPVMKLLLQPLIENAVFHGIEPKSGACTLFLGARLEQDDLLISVYDDGAGIKPEQLKQIRSALEASVSSHSSEHVGLINVQHRIRLRYGEPYGITISSAPDEGTRVIVRLPANPERNPLC